MHVGKPILEQRDDQLVLKAPIEWSQGKEWLWFSVPADLADALAEGIGDAFLAGLLPLAMALDEELELDAPVSKTLVFNIHHGYARILQHQIPELHDPRINTELLDHPIQQSNPGVATAISGGVDSSHVITEYFLAKNVPDALKITDLVFFNVGSNGDRPSAETSKVFEVRLERMKQMAASLSLPLITVDSNLAEFHQAVGFDHSMTSTIRNFAAVLAIQSRVHTYLLASGPGWARNYLSPTEFMEFSDAYSLPVLRTESLRAFGVGGELSRAEKVEKIAGYEFVQQNLRPCLWTADNCGRCFKCKNTQLALEIIGMLDKFAHLFDPAMYARERDAYVAMIITEKQPWDLEFIRFAAERNYRLTASRKAHARYWARRIASKTPRSLRVKTRAAFGRLGA